MFLLLVTVCHLLVVLLDFLDRIAADRDRDRMVSGVVHALRLVWPYPDLPFLLSLFVTPAQTCG